MTRLILTLLLCTIFSRPIFSAPGAPPSLQQAQQEFIKQNYDTAITLYRKHLRLFPKDYSAWSQLGASYFHAGLPKKAIKTLQKVERSTPDRSYNYFYQGLCFSVLGMKEAAVKYFQYTASFSDEYASRSIFELAVIDYKRHDSARAKYWLSQYQQKFPNGVYRPKVIEMLQSLQSGKWLEDVEGIEKPDMEKATYRYSGLSLFNYPHYWFIKTGGQGKESEGFQPVGQPLGALESKTSTEYSFNLDTGIGIGPLREKKMSAWGGYNYRQEWIIEQETLDNWLSNLGDFSAFPLKSTFMERRHQFYGDARREMFTDFFLGIFGRLEYRRLGSKLFPSQEDDDLRVVISVSDTTLMIPWVGYAFTENIRTLFYWYLRKEINNTSPEHSNKTYDFQGESGDPAVSLGITHSMEFPQIHLETQLDLFQYEFIYNDVWLDYTRLGGIISANFTPIPQIEASALIGMYNDDYKVDRPRSRGCGDAPEESNSGSTTSPDLGNPENCRRADSGFMWGLGAAYHVSQNLRFAINYTSISNKSTKEYTEDKTIYMFDVMWAFPSTKRVSRFVDRFADSAFTKDVE